MLGQMGYNGGGLGKRGDGIQQPVTIERNEGREGIGNKSRKTNTASCANDCVKRVTNLVKEWPTGSVDSWRFDDRRSGREKIAKIWS